MSNSTENYSGTQISYPIKPECISAGYIAPYQEGTKLSYQEKNEKASSNFAVAVGIIAVPFLLLLLIYGIIILYRIGETSNTWLEQFKNIISNFFKSTIGKPIIKAYDFVKEKLCKIWEDFLKYVVKPIKEGAEDLVDDAVDLAGRAREDVTQIWGAIKKTGTDIINAWVGAVTKIFEAIEDAWNAVKPAVESIFNSVVEATELYFKIVFDFWKTIFEGTINIISAIGDVIADIIDGFTAVVNFATNFFDNIGDAIKDVVEDAFSFF